MAQPYVSVIVPVFNEQDNLPPLLGRLAAVLGGYGRPYELILVNDGSRDDSLAILRSVAHRAANL